MTYSGRVICSYLALFILESGIPMGLIAKIFANRTRAPSSQRSILMVINAITENILINLNI